MTKRLILFLFTSLVVVLGVGSCVDVPSNGELPPNYKTMIRFIHVATDAGAGSVTIDGSAKGGSLSFGGISPWYSDVPAGGRRLKFGSDTLTQNVNLISNNQHTVLIVARSGNTRFLNLDEGYNFRNNASPGIAQVRFINAANGSATSIKFRDNDVFDRDTIASAYNAVEGYKNITPGSHTFIVVSNEGSAVIDTSSSSAQVKSSGSARVVLGDSAYGVRYWIQVTSDNSQGFYSGAHFHNAPAGSTGPVVHSIDVSGQKITFPEIKLEGKNEVPPETTNTKGTANFELTANANRTQFSLSYTIVLQVDSSDTLTAAHFHNAASGVIGSVVRSINVGSGLYRDTTLRGIWRTSDAQSLTPALIDSIVQGKIYVNVHSRKDPSGTIRGQLLPDPTSTNIYSGQWNDASLTSALRTALAANNIYVNFHTNANPAGEIRGQVIFESGSAPGVAALSATNFAAGRRYTIVATGSGQSLRLWRFEERQFGINKLAYEK
jgi:hypothetical protein